MALKNTTSKKQRSSRQSTHTWHLVTNHQNMLYMLAAGMVMGPAGFRGKHYSDPLSDYPGWIPLFRNKVKIPTAAISQAISESKHLLPCIAAFDLHNITGNFQLLPCKGKTRVVTSLPKKAGKNEIAVLLRAPLPLTVLSGIHFRSEEDMQLFKSAAGDVSNVELSSHHIEVAESLFSTATDVTWPPMEVSVELSEGDKLPAFGQALGGMLTMLYHTANRSELGLAAFRLVTGAARDKDKDLAQSDPILAELPNWMNGDEMAEQSDTRARLFWGVVHTLIIAQTQNNRQTPIDVVLAYLENQIDRLQEPEFRRRLERLIADMRGLTGLGDGTITELFERHKGSLSRALLLFCVRGRCTAMLEYSHPLLSDAEYIVAGILFGVRDGWLQLPREFRDPDFSAYVTFRMTEAEHRKQGDKLAAREPPRPHPLRELFTLPSGESNYAHNEAALKLAHECNWNDCIKTHITLADGDYPEIFKREGLQIVLPGLVTMTEEVNKAKFLHRLGQWPPIDAQIESEVRKKLVSSQDTEEQANGNG